MTNPHTTIGIAFAAAATVLCVHCSHEPSAFLAFPADLKIANQAGAAIFVTPIGIDARGQHCLLPVIRERNGQLFYARQRKDFKIRTSDMLDLKFDYDDCQFAGIILVSDHKGLRRIVTTADKARTARFFPPLQPAYAITKKALLGQTQTSDTLSSLFEQFKLN